MFKIGDVVQLKSGGLRMTIARADEPKTMRVRADDPWIRVVWSCPDGTAIGEGEVRVDALESVTEEPRPVPSALSAIWTAKGSRLGEHG